MRLTLFWYMILSPFVEFPVSCSGHTRRSQARGPAPKVEALHLRRLRRNPLVVLCEKIWTETVIHGRHSRSRRASCRRAPVLPRSRDRAEGGIQNARRPLDQSSHLTPGHGCSPLSLVHRVRKASGGRATSVAWAPIVEESRPSSSVTPRTKSTRTFLAPEPFVQIRDTKTPGLADMASLDLASAS
jgi:hypothetical protein